MSITDASKKYHEKMFPGYHSSFLKTDPEFIERFDKFAFDELVNHDDLDGRTRFMAILAVLLGCQGIDEFRIMLIAAMNFKVTPVEIKEIIYQAITKQIPYGIYNATNEGYTTWYDFTKEILEEQGIKCKVNPVTTEEYIKMMNVVQAKRPFNSQMSKEKLEKCGINVTIRREMGRDIDGACGQLRRRHMSGDKEREV